MSDILLIVVAVPIGIGATGLLGLILQPRDYPRRRFTKIDRGQTPFHGRNN